MIPMIKEIGRFPTPEGEVEVLPTVSAIVAGWDNDPLVPVTVTM